MSYGYSIPENHSPAIRAAIPRSKLCRDTKRHRASRERRSTVGLTEGYVRGFSTWGIQTGPIAACKDDFVPKYSKLPDLYTGSPIPYYPRQRGWI